MLNKSLEDLQNIRNKCALTLLGLHKKANAGHVGSSLSCLEILVDLCFTRASKEDVIILSKGHGASALYTTFAMSGRIGMAALDQYYQNGGHLAAHPPCSGVFDAIPFGTGSLGHGLSLAAGIAFSQRYTGRSFQVYCILSEGDCNEGSTWEAALFASQHKLDQLTVIVDANGIQGLGPSSEILELEPLDQKWKSFGFLTETALDGNSFESLNKGYKFFESNSNSQPRCLIARTIKGHSVSFMENKMEWHYLPMDEHQFLSASKDTVGDDA